MQMQESFHNVSLATNIRIAAGLHDKTVNPEEVAVIK